MTSPRIRALTRAVSALLFLATPGFAQWLAESPIPTSLEIAGLAAPAPSHLFLATDDNSFDDGGALWESTDGGTSWLQRDVPFSLASGFHGIFFLDDQRGWAWGNVSYRTIDGGTTWEELPLLGSTYRMEFFSPSFGIASSNPYVWVSLDGGLSWSPPPHELRNFAFANGTTGLGVGATGIYRTQDGGASFALVQAGDARAVTFLSESAAVAIVDDTLLRSSDGGLSWTAGPSALGRTSLHAVSADIALAWGRSGSFPDYDDRMLRSADGGASWADLGEVVPHGFFLVEPSFTRPDALTLLIPDGAGGLFRSTDAGQTWSQAFVSPGPTPYYLGTSTPVFVDASVGYYAFGPGYMVATDDGGASWSQLSSGAAAHLNDLDRFADGSQIAVGDAGTVLIQTSPEERWRLQSRLTPLDLVAVQVLGPQDVVALDADGRIYRSADGGTSWTPGASVPASLDARDCFFQTPVAGWVVGIGFSGAALFRTVDGGDSWIPTTTFQGRYAAVDFAGTAGWAVAENGTLQRTTDGGSTWTESQLPGSPATVRDVRFASANIGYAVGAGGYAVRSDDGGASWSQLPTPSTSDHLYDIALIGADELWVAATAGRALYTATGGQHWAVVEAGDVGFSSFTSITANATGTAWTAGGGGTIRRFDGPPPPPVNQPPLASFTFVATGLSVAFTDTSSDADGTISTWSWDFGDGTSSTEPNPTHLFAEADTYIVRLTVTDDDGDGDGAVAFIAVQPGPGGTFGEFTEVTPLDPLFVTPQNEDFWVATAAPADYDGDGDLDIAVLGYYVVYNTSVEEMLVLLRNDGPAGLEEWEFAYTEVPLGTVSAGASDLAWGDVDGDGDQDLMVASDGQTVLYRNDAGTLIATDTTLPGYWEDNDQADFDLNSVSWADYDNDGDLDLLLPSVWDSELFSYRTALLRNDGANGSGGWTFNEVPTNLAGAAHAQSSWADFDGDLDLDLLLVNLAPLTNNGFIRRYRNDGDGVFVGEDILGSLTIEHGEAQWGDADGDGDLDILVAGHIRETSGSYNTVLRLYRNDAETYVPIAVIDCPSCEGWFDLTAASWADYDSDGDIDILLAGTYNSGSQIEGRARVYINVGGSFTDSGNQLPAPRASGNRGGSFSWLDLDADGDLDYFIAGQYFVPGGNGLVDAQMHLYLNGTTSTNQAPTAPWLLGSQVELDGSVLLWWNSASDDSTPPSALTYNLQVAALNAPTSTIRHTPEPGNLSAVDQWTLRGLPDGQYRWTLTAVDSAYNGSPPASASFLVGPAPTPIFSDGFESGDLSNWGPTP